MSIDMRPGKVIAKKYVLGDEINCGSFARVFQIKKINEKEFTKVLKMGKSNELNEKYQTEVSILKCCRGQKSFPQITDEISINNFKCIVMTHSGESVADLLERKPTQKFSNSNILRMTTSLFRALDTLHRIGFVHRDIHKGNMMLKLSNGRLVFTLIDFGNSALAKSTLKYHSKSIAININVNFGKTEDYAPIDDFINSIYCLTKCAGIELFNVRFDAMIQAKEKFHRDPCAAYDASRKWMGLIMKKLLEIKNDQLKDHKPVWKILDTAIPHCLPTSPIKFKIIEDEVYIE
ncbi:hypothetical protein GCK72_022575 [Caenorhabditis remanei]|uniref:Protein kinase domain-containing protein n=1 Tax=Caenorhabditis remanei TaxID=31234 RepID=A0A6A5FUA3_CAERE|nr:hypothetical protein GCK72_022575 [Caenorhabditis remanei]KAF1746123.1 hypothetical protein GCK72_022575 [Caenorhabditis remanei]